MRTVLSPSCLALTVITAAGGACSPTPPSSSAQPVKVTHRLACSAWGDKGRRLLIRRVGNDQAGLFLRCLTHGEDLQERYRAQDSAGTNSEAPPTLPILRFRPGAQALEATDARSWGSVTTPVGGAIRPAFLDIVPFEWDQDADELRFDEEVVDTRGRWTVLVSVAPKGDRIHVVSAEAKRDASTMLGESKAFSGEFFCETFLLSTRAPVGKTVRLADAAGHSQIEATYTPDGSYLVYANARFSAVWIIPLTEKKKDEGVNR